MVITSDCPRVDALERLLLGQISVVEADSLEGHVLDCPYCLNMLRGMTTVDPLVEAMREAHTQSMPQPSDAAEALIPWLKRLRPKDAAQTLSLNEACAPTPVPGAALSTFDFLAPPQQADELGRLGNYRVLQAIGVGGMGMVFLAEDLRLKRRVALKLIKPDLLARQDLHERFLTEARTIAAVEHDNIVAIYEADQTAGVPYLAMPLLLGESLEDYLRKHPGPLPVDALLRTGREIAAGLAAAHARGVIHRDIKPSNLWLENRREPRVENRQEPRVESRENRRELRPALDSELSALDYSELLALDSLRVKILDFGLARGVEGIQPEGEQAVLGTPAYMSPEQGRGLPSDARSDLFSLGCVLYRMATGRIPFQGKDVITTLLNVATETPVSPKQLNPTLPVKLAALIEKLLAKKPDQRFKSAQEVVTAIQAIERKRRPNSHLRWLVVTAGCIAMAALGTFGLVSYLHRAPAPVEITFEYDEADTGLVVRRDDEPEQEIEVNKRARQMLTPGTYAIRSKQKHDGRSISPPTFVVNADEPKVVPLRLVGLIRSHGGHSRSITSVAVAPGKDSFLALSASDDHDLRLWDLRTPAAGIPLDGHESPVHCVAISPDGKRAVSGSGKASGRLPDTFVRIWDLNARECIARLSGHESSVMAIAFDPHGTHFISGDRDGMVLFWDAKTQKLSGAVHAHDRSDVLGVTFLPDGKQALSCGADHKLLLWDVEKRCVTKVFAGHKDTVTGVTAAPDGKHAATSGKDGAIRVWNLQSGNSVVLNGHEKDVDCIAYSPDGKRLFSGGRDATVRLWNAETGELLHTFQGHRGAVHGVAFAFGGRRAVSGGGDHLICLWELPK